MGSTAICDCVKLKICIFNNWSVEKNANADVTYESTLRPKGYRTAELKFVVVQSHITELYQLATRMVLNVVTVLLLFLMELHELFVIAGSLESAN